MSAFKNMPGVTAGALPEAGPVEGALRLGGTAVVNGAAHAAEKAENQFRQLDLANIAKGLKDVTATETLASNTVPQLNGGAKHR